jgi:predicted RNA-binding protein with PUA-like domain
LRHWLVKQEPEELSFADFRRAGRATWDGVRNAQARIHLRAMVRGDAVLWYATGTVKAAVGTATVAQAAYPDPTDPAGAWVAVDLAAGTPLPRPVGLAQVRVDPLLARTALVAQPRLSVLPLTAAQHARFLELGGAA